MSCISVKLCEFSANELTLVDVYGFGAEPMLLPGKLNLLATLVAGYTGLTSAVHSGSFFKGTKGMLQTIYEVSKLIFYALGYALEGALSMCRKGINGFSEKGNITAAKPI